MTDLGVPHGRHVFPATDLDRAARMLILGDEEGHPGPGIGTPRRALVPDGAPEDRYLGPMEREDRAEGARQQVRERFRRQIPAHPGLARGGAAGRNACRARQWPGLAYHAAMTSDRTATARGAPGVVAIVPVGVLEGAKSRLGETLDAEERRDLVIGLLRTTLDATGRTPEIAETIVVTPDDEIRQLALEAGARPFRQRGQGLNRGLNEAREEAIAGGAVAILVLPIDLPLVSPGALADVLAPLHDPRRPLVVIVPDRHGRGTNALLVAPPDAIEFGFGGDSRAAHADCAREVGARLVELRDGPLALDLDTPADLLLVGGVLPEAVDAH